MEDLREQLAAYSHGAWAGWMRYMETKLYKLSILGHVLFAIMPRWYILRWTRQMNADYADLSESEKKTDRDEADKILLIAFPHGPEPWCCYLGCQKRAEWVIEYDNGTPAHDNYSHACTGHLGNLLQDCSHTVYPLETD